MYNSQTKSWSNIDISKFARPKYWDGERFWFTTSIKIFKVEPVSGKRDLYNSRKLPFLGRHHINSVDYDGKHYWFGTIGDYNYGTKRWHSGGVIRVNSDLSGAVISLTSDGIAGDYVSNIAANKAGVWVSHRTVNEGLSFFDKTLGVWKPIQLAVNDKPVGGRKMVDGGKHLWVGHKSALFRIDKTLRRASLFVPKGIEYKQPYPTLKVYDLNSDGNATWGAFSGSVIRKSDYAVSRIFILKLPVK